ncbi:ATP-binding cassette domain-containing protein [bacterium]|nr:ATP-binding cassette domain-containing protein [bacterium]
MKIVLDAIGLTYDRGLPTARSGLDGVDLSIASGDAVAVMGPTGSGKTTLLEVAAGLVQPTVGSASLDDGAAKATLRSCVGLVYQFPELQFFEETVFDEVAYGLRAGRTPEDETEQRVHAALNRVALSPDVFADRSPLTLSAGEQRRAAIAALVVLERPFLLLDEPSAGLDPANRDLILELILGERRNGRAIGLVTHDPELAERTVDRVVVLAEGRLEADGTPGDVFSDADMLGRLGLEAPPAHELVNALRRRNPVQAHEIASIVL